MYNEEFLREVDEIKNFFDLPIIIPTAKERSEKFTEAFRVFFQERLLSKVVLILKIILLSLFSHVDVEKVKNFTHFLNSGEADSLFGPPQNKIIGSYAEPKVSYRQKIFRFDFYFPDTWRYIGNYMVSENREILSAIISGKLSRRIRLNSRFKLTVDELGLFFSS